jgi:Trypsin-like peptidase domain
MSNHVDRIRSSRLIQTARTLLSSGGTLESRSGTVLIDQGRISAALEQHVDESHALGVANSKLVAAEVLSNVKRALAKSAADANVSNLTDGEWASLEAIVQVTGRPALRYKDEKVEMPNDVGENEHWAVLIATARANINRVSRSVGRVSRKGPAATDQLVGTAWRIGDTLVVTNRHVAAGLVLRATDPVPSWKLDPAKTPQVCFESAGDMRFAIRDIAYCAPEEDIDMAIMRLDCTRGAPPPPLSIDWAPESLGQDVSEPGEEEPRFKGKEVYVVGHPYRQVGSSAIAKVFGCADGSKRCSPGFVTAISGAYLEHDCSTLGGNSGSCVLTTGHHAVVGLHAGGMDVDERSGQGRANVALALAQLRDSSATSILKAGSV